MPSARTVVTGGHRSGGRRCEVVGDLLGRLFRRRNVEVARPASDPSQVESSVLDG